MSFVCESSTRLGKRNVEEIKNHPWFASLVSLFLVFYFSCCSSTVTFTVRSFSLGEDDYICLRARCMYGPHTLFGPPGHTLYLRLPRNLYVSRISSALF